MNRSIIIALGIFVALVLYFGVGLMLPDHEEETIQEVEGKPIMTVQVREVEAEEISREVIVAGRTTASRTVELKSEISGIVEKVPGGRGTALSRGDVVLQLSMEDRAERLLQAKAGVEQTRLEWEAARKLEAKSLRSASQVALALERYRGAQQGLKAIELEIEKTTIRAPFDGMLNDRQVEEGDYVRRGDMVGEILDIDPLIVEGDVNEYQINKIHPGEHGTARLPDGTEVEGHIRYVASEAKESTRTFPVEMAVDNPDRNIPVGVTAQIVVETERVYAHKISPALISIADDGRFGIKYVDEDNRVKFAEADLVKSSPDWVWLGSLPREIKIITVGQGFTHEGDLVKPEIDRSGW